MEYKVIAKFLSYIGDGTNTMVKMIVVQDERGACTMTEDEWRYVYGRQHMEKWKNKSIA